jgi:hypothetical protein
VVGQDLKFPDNAKVMNYIRNIMEYLSELEEEKQDK